MPGLDARDERRAPHRAWAAAAVAGASFAFLLYVQKGGAISAGLFALGAAGLVWRRSLAGALTAYTLAMAAALVAARSASWTVGATMAASALAAWATVVGLVRLAARRAAGSPAASATLLVLGCVAGVLALVAPGAAARFAALELLGFSSIAAVAFASDGPPVPSRRLVGAWLASSAVLAMGVGLARSEAGRTATAASGLVLLGLAYKLGSVPLYAWMPLLLRHRARAVAIFGGLVALPVVALLLVRTWASLGAAPHGVVLCATALAAVALVEGSLRALRRDDVRCALSYAAVAQSGIIVAALVAGGRVGRTAALVAALQAALACGIGALVMTPRSGERVMALGDLESLGRRSPAAGAALTLAALALAGLVPVPRWPSRWDVLGQLWLHGGRPLALALALASLVLVVELATLARTVWEP